MAVFGKGRTGNPNRMSRLKPFVGREVGHVNGRRKLFSRNSYVFEQTSFGTISTHFGGLFHPESGFIAKRFAQTGQPVRVLDWGCGKAVAIQALAEKFGSKVEAYGFSKDSYRSWKVVENAKLIHATADGLLRYIKPGSMDLIYSYLGLYHHHPAPYISKLVTRLRPGGKLVFDMPGRAATENLIPKLEEALPSGCTLRAKPKMSLIEIERHS